MIFQIKQTFLNFL